MLAKLKGLLLPFVLTIAALAVLVSLGNWQVRRLAWKEDLIARVAERPSLPPIDMRGADLAETGDPGAFLERNEHRPMLVSGVYVPDGEVLAFTSLERPRGPAGGPGYWVLTPFVTPPSGAIVLVNRGFVPDGRTDSYAAPPTGEVTIKGLVRAPETGSWATPKPDMAKRIFYARDPLKIGRATGFIFDLPGAPSVSPFMPFFIDLAAEFTPESGLPQAGETRMSFPNNHLQYAITWYGLAAALLAVFSVFAWRRMKEPQARRLTAQGPQP